MEKKVRCGVIGAGWWATFAHIPALLAHPNAELVALQKRNFEAARRVAGDFNIPHACTTTDELLAVEGLQAVIISSSPDQHFAQASAALSAGKHILIEKPMTLTTAEAAQLNDLAQARDLQFLISCPWHYTPHAIESQRLIREGELGDIRMISILMTNPVGHLLRGTGTEATYGEPYMTPHHETYSDPRVSGAGQVYTQVSHVAAYVSFLTGLHAAEIFARFHNDGAVLDIYDGILVRLENNAIVSIASTGATAKDRRDYEVRVFGTKGMLFLDLWNGRMEFVEINGKRRNYPPLDPDFIYPHQAPAKNLVDTVLDPAKNGSPAWLGVAAMEMIEGACISAARGVNVHVKDLTGGKDYR